MDSTAVVVVKNKDDDNKIIIICPNCNYKANVSIEKLKIFKREMRVKCKCSTVFKVKLEFRREPRKESSFDGLYYNPLELDENSPANHSNGKSFNLKNNCRVKDISMHGIGFEVRGKHFITEGKRFKIRFKLGPTVHHEIEKDIEVRFVKNNFIGCEFLETELYRDKIGFYMM